MMISRSVIAAEKKSSFAADAMIVVGASLLLGLLAHAAIPLPFTPVPIVLQVQAALVLGALLGRRRGTLAVALFLLQGALGLPVFSLGRAGIAYLLGPTGGYLVGYAAGAFVAGSLLERSAHRSPLRFFSAMACGNGVVYLLGSLQLSLYVGYAKALLLGVAPFVIGDLLKLLALVFGLKRLRLT